MNLVIFILVCVTSAFSYAKNPTYDFKKKTVVLIDANTGEPVKDQKVVVYHQYEYPCMTDLVRPSQCVNGSHGVLDAANGKVQIEAQKIEKVHLLGKKPQVGFQVQGPCEGQEWHPGECIVWIPLKEFNDAKEPFEIKFPFKLGAAKKNGPAEAVR